MPMSLHYWIKSFSLDRHILSFRIICFSAGFYQKKHKIMIFLKLRSFLDIWSQFSCYLRMRVLSILPIVVLKVVSFSKAHFDFQIWNVWRLRVRCLQKTFDYFVFSGEISSCLRLTIGVHSLEVDEGDASSVLQYNSVFLDCFGKLCPWTFLSKLCVPGFFWPASTEKNSAKGR